MKNFTTLRRSLEAERNKMVARLQAINAALGESAPVAAPVAIVKLAKVKTAKVKAAKRGPRARNGLSLKAAIIEATKAKPLSKEEIFEAVKKLGYQFTTKKPMASINGVLHSKNPRFKNQDGKFSAA